MKAAGFRDWIKPIERMSRSQRNKLRERLEGKTSVDEPINLIEQAPNVERVAYIAKGRGCSRWGKTSELQRYKCRHCNRTFNALTGMALARLRGKDKWLDYERAMVEGISVRKAAASCGIARNTSFKWRHRFLRVPAIHQANKMHGIVEADEMYFLESFKGQRHLPRAARKRGGKAAKRGTSKEQLPVLVIRDRHGETDDHILQDTSESKSEQCLSLC